MTSHDAASVPRVHSHAAVGTELQVEHIGQEMFDPPDLKGGGAITLDDWQESYSEHMATVTVKMDEFYTLAHAATEQFKKFRLNQSSSTWACHCPSIQCSFLCKLP